MKAEEILRRIRNLLALFMVLLVLSGLTAFPLEPEVAFVNGMDFLPESMVHGISVVYTGLQETNAKFPFLAYGTDWLAFAHLAIAIFFIAPLQDPVKNIAVIKAGMFISLAIFPLAFIAGNIRGIPFYWQLIDCSFGVFSFLLFGHCFGLIRKLEQIQLQHSPSGSPRNQLLVCPFHDRKSPFYSN